LFNIFRILFYFKIFHFFWFPDFHYFPKIFFDSKFALFCQNCYFFSKFSIFFKWKNMKILENNEIGPISDWNILENPIFFQNVPISLFPQIFIFSIFSAKGMEWFHWNPYYGSCAFPLKFTKSWEITNSKMRLLLILSKCGKFHKNVKIASFSPIFFSISLCLHRAPIISFRNYSRISKQQKAPFMFLQLRKILKIDDEKKRKREKNIFWRKKIK